MGVTACLAYTGACDCDIDPGPSSTLCLLQQVTILTDLSPSFDKWCTIGFMVLSGVAAMAVLDLCPKGVLSFDTQAASEALSHATGNLMRSKATTDGGKV